MASTLTERLLSKKKRKTASGIVGVTWSPAASQWRVRLTVKGEIKGGKYFIGLKEAVEERIRLEQKYFGKELGASKTLAMRWLDRVNRRQNKA